jgi:PAS domain S-box-containing protein
MKSRLYPTQAPGDDPPRFARTSEQTKAEIEERFGFFPPFFTPALETPEILELLWRQTLSAYVNNPLPVLFKEKLFAYLSRYCAVPYCIICHSCALRPLGMTAAEVLALLTEPGPAIEMEISKHRDLIAAQPSPLDQWPVPGSALDESLMACSIFSFLNPAQAEDCRAQLRRLLGEEKCAYLMVFLGYVKTCHLWVEAHPELAYEADKRAQENLGYLLAEEPRLAEFFRNYNKLIARERQGREERLRAEPAALECERKAMREAKDEMETKVANIVESAMDAIIAVDAEQRVVLFNAAAERMFQCPADEALGQPLGRFLPERFRHAHQEHIRAFGQTKTTRRSMGSLGAVFGLRADGEEFPIEASISQVETGGQKLFTVILRDITQRQRTQERLRQERDKAQQYLDVVEVMLLALNSNGEISMINRKGCRALGYEEHELIGRNWFEICVSAEEREVVQAVFRRLMNGKGEQVEYFENQVLTKTGEKRLVRWHNITLRDESGKPIGTLSSGDDITEGRRAKEKLIEQAALLNLAQDVIIVRDLNDRVVFWNKSAERVYGWTAEEAIGRDVKEMQFGDSVSEFEQANRTVREKGAWAGEIRQVARDGRKLIFDCNWTLVRDEAGNPKSILAINTDITEKKRLEAQFLRAQRLESIGTLASGIAHDLNNILSPITMGAQMLQMKQQDEQSQRLLEVMRTNAERGAAMIKQVLSFARGIGGERVTIQPKHLIREIARLAEETFPKSIRITQHLSEGLWATSGDHTQLQQVLMNLCVNARDAMPNGGELTIEAQNQALDEMYAGMLRGASAGNFVVITVTDTGQGIPPEIIDRIFDPFFTTKAPGQGTGLGLATVQGIVTNHSGFITVESKPGLGTKFKIHLPAYEAASLKQVEEEYSDIPSGNGELILVIDDEAAVREMTGTTLEAFGYRVMMADNGVTALSVFAGHKDEISVVITDMMMPLMDGPMTIRALRKLNPQVCIIASSGLNEAINAADLDQLGVKIFLIKPYGAKALLKTVAQALSQSRYKFAS